MIVAGNRYDRKFAARSTTAVGIPIVFGDCHTS